MLCFFFSECNNQKWHYDKKKTKMLLDFSAISFMALVYENHYKIAFAHLWWMKLLVGIYCTLLLECYSNEMLWQIIWQNAMRILQIELWFVISGIVLFLLISLWHKILVAITWKTCLFHEVLFYMYIPF